MMEYPDARRVAAMLAALAEPTRLRIMYHLVSGPHHVSQLAGAPMVNMSHHLGVMRQAGLLEDEKDGRRVVYRFRPEVLAPGDGPGILATLILGPFRVMILSEPGALPVRPKARRKPAEK
jgi:DNA-binding transcriptional ArsR family regulator